VIRRLLVPGILAALLLGSAFFVRSFADLYTDDEVVHYDQIARFARGDLSLNAVVTTLPGYHALLGLIGYATGATSVPFMRFLSLLIGLVTIGVFWLITREISRDAGWLRLLQFVSFPLLFPFFFLLHTDVLALLLVLLTGFFTLRERFTLAAVMSLAGVLVRQTNIVWGLFFFCLSYTRSYGFSVEWPAVMTHMRRAWLFPVSIMFFGVFVIINKGVAVGDREAHNVAGLFLGNIYFFLFLTFFLFFPVFVDYWKVLFAQLKEWKILLSLCCIFVVYLMTFSVTHPYNQAQYTFYLRNKVLLFFSETLVDKILFFLPMAGSVLFFAKIRLCERPFLLLYPTTFLFFLPMWLIEQRYYLIPFTLFLVMREQRSVAAEVSMVLLFVISALLFAYGITHHLFLL
jgi:alpha-1,2-glucosyltransferase